DELLLSERQPRGALVRECVHADEIEQLFGALGLVTGHRVGRKLTPPKLAQRRDEVLEHRHLAEETRDLKGPAEPELCAPPRPQPHDPFSVEPDLRRLGTPTAIARA